jgi:hypothetical protein
MRVSTSENLTILETAAELRCSKAHVYNLIAGKVAGLPPLPAIRLGRRKLVRLPTLLAWAAAIEGAAKHDVLRSPRYQGSEPLDA